VGLSLPEVTHSCSHFLVDIADDVLVFIDGPYTVMLWFGFIFDKVLNCLFVNFLPLLSVSEAQLVLLVQGEFIDELVNVNTISFVALTATPVLFEMLLCLGALVVRAVV